MSSWATPFREDYFCYVFLNGFFRGDYLFFQEGFFFFFRVGFFFFPMKKDRTENIQKTYKKCAPYGNCTEIVQKIYKKCAKICNSSLVKTGSLFELVQILAHFIYILYTFSV